MYPFPLQCHSGTLLPVQNACSSAKSTFCWQTRGHTDGQDGSKMTDHSPVQHTNKQLFISLTPFLSQKVY